MPFEGYDKDMAKPAGMKSRFVRGVAALLPTLLTIWVVSTVWRFTFDTIAAPINASIREAVIRTADVLPPLKDAFQPSEEQLELARARAATRGDEPPTATELLTQNIDQWWSQPVWLGSHWFAGGSIGHCPAGDFPPRHAWPMGLAAIRSLLDPVANCARDLSFRQTTGGLRDGRRRAGHAV